MRRRCGLGLVAALALLVGWTFTPVAGAEGLTTILLVRHAERAAEGTDPPLSPEGTARAAELVRVLADVEIHAAYSSQFRRARDTAEPLAKSRGLDVRTDDVDGGDLPGWARAFAARLLERHAGQVVLVSGHSNSVPPLIEALGVRPAPPIAHHAYDDLFIVTVDDGRARLLHLHYGAPSVAPGP